MAGPWEKYAGSSDTSAAAAAGPWQKYGSTDAAPSSGGKASADERPVGAFAESAGNMMSLGYLPQIKAALVDSLSQGKIPLTSVSFPGVNIPREKVLAAIDRPLSEVVSGDAFKNLKPLNSYVDVRDAASKSARDLADANPIANAAGVVTGIIAPSGAESALFKGGEIAKNASTAQKVLRAGAKGAITAGLFNPGDKEGEVSPIQLDKRVKQAEVGGLASLLLGGAGAVVSKGATRLAPAEAAAASAVEDAVDSGALAPAASEGEAIQRSAGARSFGERAVAKGQQIVPVYKDLVSAAEEKLGRDLTEPELFAQHKLARQIVENGGKVVESAVSNEPAAAAAVTEMVQPTKDALEKVANSKTAALLSLLGGFKSYGAFKGFQKYGPALGQKGVDALSSIEQTGITPGIVGGAIARRLNGGN